jgi:antitoxin component YwqK of YwqJK toxin-antitoxin module
VAILKFGEGGHSLARLRKGKLHGTQLRWDTHGSLLSLRSYRDGKEHGDSVDWSGGELRTLRHVEEMAGMEDFIE